MRSLPLFPALVLVASIVGCGAVVGVTDAEGGAPAGEAGETPAEGGPPPTSHPDASGSCDEAFLTQRCDHLFTCKHPNGDASPLSTYQAECQAELLAGGIRCPAHVTGYCLQFTSTEDCSILNDPTFVPVQCSVGL